MHLIIKENSLQSWTYRANNFFKGYINFLLSAVGMLHHLFNQCFIDEKKRYLQLLESTNSAEMSIHTHVYPYIGQEKQIFTSRIANLKGTSMYYFDKFYQIALNGFTYVSSHQQDMKGPIGHTLANWVLTQLFNFCHSDVERKILLFYSYFLNYK